jgi:hypothetical protein
VTVPQQHEWKKSPASGEATNCVEVRDDLEAVRDTKNREAGNMRVSRASFGAFILAISDSKFRPTA